MAQSPPAATDTRQKHTTDKKGFRDFRVRLDGKHEERKLPHTTKAILKQLCTHNQSRGVGVTEIVTESAKEIDAVGRASCLAVVHGSIIRHGHTEHYQ